MRRCWVFALLLLTGTSAFGLSISPGDARERVLLTYGYPASQAKAGDREIFNYPEGSVILHSGKVVELRFTRTEPRLAVSPTTKPAASLTQTKVVTRPPTVTLRQSATKVRQSDNGRVSFPSVSPPPLEGPSGVSSGFKAWFYVIPTIAISFIGMALLGNRSQRRRRRWESILDEGSGVETPRHPQLHTATIPPPKEVARARETMVGSALTLDLLTRLEWRRFEELAHALFATQDWKPQRSHVGADGGIDIFLYRSGQGRPGAIVQCKAHHKPVDVKHVREFFGVMASENISEGYFVSRSGYTLPAREFAEGKTLWLWSGEDLVAKFAGLETDAQSRIMAYVFRDDFETPTCVACDVKMVRREGGDKTTFWGCRHYPRCRRTMTVREG